MLRDQQRENEGDEQGKGGLLCFSLRLCAGEVVVFIDGRCTSVGSKVVNSETSL